MTIYLSHLFSDEEIKKILKEYENEFSLGIETIDFAAGIYLDELEETARKYQERLSYELDKYPLSIHGPFLDLCPHSFDSLVRKITMERYQQTYHAAKKTGARHVIFHSCLIPSIYFGSTWEENSVEFWKEFLKDKDDSVQIHIENVFEENYEHMENLLNRIGSPLLTICLDVGHAHAYSDIVMEKWFENLGNKIGHIHIHNNDGKKDFHWPLNKGTLDIKEVMNLAKKYAPQSDFTLEMNSYEDTKESLEYLKMC